MINKECKEYPEWKYKLVFDGHKEYFCPNCGEESPLGLDIDPNDDGFICCPYCAAKIGRGCATKSDKLVQKIFNAIENEKEDIDELLSDFGIQAKDQNGNYKSAYCVLLEFANKLNQQAEETADGN